MNQDIKSKNKKDTDRKVPIISLNRPGDGYSPNGDSEFPATEQEPLFVMSGGGVGSGLLHRQPSIATEQVDKNSYYGRVNLASVKRIDKEVGERMKEQKKLVPASGGILDLTESNKLLFGNNDRREFVVNSADGSARVSDQNVLEGDKVKFDKLIAQQIFGEGENGENKTNVGNGEVIDGAKNASAKNSFSDFGIGSDERGIEFDNEIGGADDRELSAVGDTGGEVIEGEFSKLTSVVEKVKTIQDKMINWQNLLKELRLEKDKALLVAEKVDLEEPNLISVKSEIEELEKKMTSLQGELEAEVNRIRQKIIEYPELLALLKEYDSIRNIKPLQRLIQSLGGYVDKKEKNINKSESFDENTVTVRLKEGQSILGAITQAILQLDSTLENNDEATAMANMSLDGYIKQILSDLRDLNYSKEMALNIYKEAQRSLGIGSEIKVNLSDSGIAVDIPEISEVIHGQKAFGRQQAVVADDYHDSIEKVA